MPYDSFMDSKTNSDNTLAMVRVREARQAFSEFYADCFWYCRKDLVIGPGDVEWVAETLRKNGDMRAWRVAGRLSPGKNLPGFVRAPVATGDQASRINWARDPAWRFMPLVEDETGGLVLHEVDLAINKVLTLAGRDDARDFVDIMQAHAYFLPLGAMIWAAAGKEPGFTPMSLLEHLKRRGRYQPEDVARLLLAQPFDLAEAKTAWRAALSAADEFIRSRPHHEVGCVYHSPARNSFVAPSPERSLKEQGLVTHFGQSGGILPRVADV